VAAALGSYDLVRSGGTTTGGATASASTVLSTSQIAAKVSPGLVDVNATLGDQHATSAGTGLVLTSTGEVLTNNHVINGATSITVTDVGNGRTYTARVVGYDQSKDIAVLQLQGASGLTTVTLGESSAVKVGQEVVAIGNAGGKGGTPSVVTGKVTALNQTITAKDASSGTSEQLSGMIQTNAPITAGDSGGPLVNTAGQVIGMDTAASSPSQLQSARAQARTQAQSTAFSIPIGEAASIARQIEGGASSPAVHIGATAFLGVEVSSPAAGGTGGFSGSGTTGAAIAGVVSGSPADAAGLTTGDTITAISGQAVTSAAQIQSVLEAHHPGDKISISWTDNFGQAHTATIVLAAGPAA
jgi:S1-C subfamily serine protease